MIRSNPLRVQAAGSGGVLVWFRRDLRIHDNETLHAAALRARQSPSCRVSFCFVQRKTTSDVWQTKQGGASLAFQYHALSALDELLCQTWGSGARIMYAETSDSHDAVADALAEISAACGSSEVYFSRCYEPSLREEERRVQVQLSKAHGLRSKSFGTYLLQEPSGIAIDMSKWKGHFGTLMPFYNACKQQGKSRGAQTSVVFPVPVDMPVEEGPSNADGCWILESPSNRFRSSIVDSRWAKKLADSWSRSNGGTSDCFGEVHALRLLDLFLQRKMSKYESSRNYADARAVSKLSPFLHFGSLSAKYMVSLMRKAGCESVSKTFWRRLVWRDLAYWQLHHWPGMPTRPIRKFYSAHQWTGDEEALERWKKGTTGFPLVDAGMRELYATGWMQQNARMCCALFLTEYLNVHWAKGAEWFHETLFDADLAINSMMWQNAGKSGLDQWNFTVSPTAKSLDPTGSYITQWVPELRELPKKHLHAPWEASEAVLVNAGVVLGVTYPARIEAVVNVSAAKDRNLEAIRKLREEAKRAGYVDENGYDVIKAPTGSCRGSSGKVRVFTKPEYRTPGVQGKRGKKKGASGSRKSFHKRGQRPRAKSGRKENFRQLSLEEALALQRDCD